MIRHRFALALAAITVSVFLAGAANALPLTTKTSTTSLTGAWKPLNWTTNAIADETNTFGLRQFDISNEPVFLLDYLASGTFTGDGYDASGTITVRYSFGTNFLPLNDFFIPDFCVTAIWDGQKSVLRVSATETDSPIGMVTVVGWNLDSGSLQPGDTPAIGDTFFLFAQDRTPFLEIAVDDGEDPKSFTATFPQLEPFEHLGPFTYSKGKREKNLFLTLLPSLLEGDDCHKDDRECATKSKHDDCDDYDDGCPSTSKDDECDDDEDECRFKWKDWVLDTDRLNADCGNEVDGFSPCGGARFSSINVPEPGTLALFGLGLAGLAVRRRSRQ